MALTREQIVRLYAAGTATIPPTFPEPGEITYEANGYKIGRKTYEILRVTYVTPPNESSLVIVRLEDVVAVLWEDDGAIDPHEPKNWSVGEEVKAKVSVVNQPLTGILFVGKHAPVLVVNEIGVAAGELGMYGDPCCCRPCST